MSITDELRVFARRWTCTDYVNKDLLAIADRIDAEHERELRETGEEIVRDVRREWVRLPLDADGEPWHIGDRTESGQTIGAMGLNKHGWCFTGTVNEIDPSIHRHCHVPTVEDVLRELLDEAEHFHSLEEEQEAIAEYVAKLRLAEGEDA